MITFDTQFRNYFKMNSKLSILSFYLITISVHASSEAETPTWDKFAGSLEDEKAAIGFTARIKCPTLRLSESPVKWFKDNVEVTGNRFTTMENGNLQITNVQFTDQGAYVCNVQDSFTTVSGTRKLLVQPPTQILELNTTDYEVMEGHQAGFKCVVLVTSLSTLQELKIIWLHNGTVIDFRSEAQRFRKVIKSYAVISDSWVIKNTTVLDAGKYTCVASTSLDNATAEKQLVISPKKQAEEQSREFVNAETVRSVKATPMSSSTLHLSWEKPEIIFGTLVGYNISFQAVDETESNSVRSRFKSIADYYPTSLKLNNLEENTKYKININAVTTVGPGETFSIEEKTMKDLDRRLIVQCTQVFDLHHRHNRTSFEYESSRKTISMLWKPWVNCDNVNSQHSMGSGFYIKYRTIHQLCFDQINEFNEEYILIPDLHFHKKYVFIVGYMDDIRRWELNPIYLELYPKSDQRPTDIIHILPPELGQSIEKTPFINVSILVQILIVLMGSVLFIFCCCCCCGILNALSELDPSDVTLTKSETCSCIICLAFVLSFIITMIFDYFFVSLTFNSPSEFQHFICPLFY